MRLVSVSTIGVKESKDALKIWRDGMQEMIKQIEPKAVLIYGGKLDFDYGDILKLHIYILFLSSLTKFTTC